MFELFDDFRALYFPPSSVHKPEYVERWVGVSGEDYSGFGIRKHQDDYFNLEGQHN